MHTYDYSVIEIKSQFASPSSCTFMTTVWLRPIHPIEKRVRRAHGTHILGMGMTAWMNWDAASLVGILTDVTRLEYVVAGDMVDSP